MHYTPAEGFLTCPFDATHSIPAAHLLMHILKHHSGDSLSTCAGSLSRMREPAEHKRVRVEEPGVQQRIAQPPPQPIQAQWQTAPSPAVSAPAVPTPPPLQGGQQVPQTGRVHVGYGDPAVPESILTEYLSQFGPVSKAFHAVPKHCFFVEFTSAASAAAALQAAPAGQRRHFRGYNFTVNPAYANKSQEHQPMAVGRTEADQQQDLALLYNAVVNTASAVAQQQQPPYAVAPRRDRNPPPPSHEPRSQPPVGHDLVSNRAPSPYLLLHNVPAAISEREMFETLRAAVPAVPAPDVITLVDAPSGSPIRSVALDYRSIAAAEAVFNAANRQQTLRFGASIAVAQYV
jgi:hypothetical protein